MSEFNSCLLGCWQENGFYSPLWLNKTIFRFSSLSIMVTSLLKGVKSCLNIQTIYFLGYTILATSSHNFANFAKKNYSEWQSVNLKWWSLYCGMMVNITWPLICIVLGFVNCKWWSSYCHMMIINDPYINDYISYWLNFGQMYKV